MKFKNRQLVRDAENPQRYEIVEFDVSFKELMTKDPEQIWNYGISIVSIWFILCIMLASFLGFTYVIKAMF